MSKVIKVARPEGGAEHGLVLERPHRCSAGAALRSTLGDDVDLLIFPVGVVGYEMPVGIPFSCTAAEPCGACGRTLTAWFEWMGAKIWLPS